MTREEAIAKLTNMMNHCYPNEEYKMAIEALEHKPCDNAISRQVVLDMLEDINAETEGVGFYYKHYVEYIKNLPPVTPQYTDAEIQKMQDLEFAEIQKAYEIGKAENPNKWIPVSERYPEDGQRVLVDYCDEDAGIMLIRFNVNGYHGFKAWMPLPEPYKASPTGEEVQDAGCD